MKKFYLVAMSIGVLITLSIIAVQSVQLTNSTDNSAEKLIQSTLLHTMVKSGGGVDEFTRLLEGNYDPDSRDVQQRTPLHWAAIMARPEEANLLLIHGADVQAKDFQGNTPLHFVGKYTTHLKDRYEVINTLLFYEADVFASNNAGYKPIDVGRYSLGSYMLKKSILDHEHRR